MIFTFKLKKRCSPRELHLNLMAPPTPSSVYHQQLPSIHLHTRYWFVWLTLNGTVRGLCPAAESNQRRTQSQPGTKAVIGQKDHIRGPQVMAPAMADGATEVLCQDWTGFSGLLPAPTADPDVQEEALSRAEWPLFEGFLTKSTPVSLDQKYQLLAQSG